MSTSATPRWSLAWLVTLWLFSLGGNILIFISSGSFYVSGGYGLSFDLIGRYGDYNGYIAPLAWGITFIICNSATLVLTFASVILFARGKLSPLYVLISNAEVLVVWLALLAASALTPPGWEILTLVGNAVLIITSAAQLIWSSILFKRQRRKQGTTAEEGKSSNDVEAAGAVAPVEQPAPVVNTVYVPVIVPFRHEAPTIDDDDSGFEEPAPEYETVVASDGGVSGSGIQKFNDA